MTTVILAGLFILFPLYREAWCRRLEIKQTIEGRLFWYFYVATLAALLGTAYGDVPSCGERHGGFCGHKPVVTCLEPGENR